MVSKSAVEQAVDLLSATRSGDDDAHIWDRYPKEGDKAYAAFWTYVQLGPHIRSIEAASKEIGKSAQLLAMWSPKHDWVLRARAYDSFERRQRYTLRMAAIIEMEKRHAQIGQTLMRLGLEALSDVDPKNIRQATALKFITEGVKVERLAARQPTDILDVYQAEPRDVREDFSEAELISLAEVAELFSPEFGTKPTVVIEQSSEDVE